MKFPNTFQACCAGNHFADTREIEFPLENRDSSGTIPFYQSVINSFPTYRQSEKNFDPFFLSEMCNESARVVIIRYQREIF